MEWGKDTRHQPPTITTTSQTRNMETHKKTSLPPSTKNSNQQSPNPMILLATITTAENLRSSLGPHTRSRYRVRRGMEIREIMNCGIARKRGMETRYR
jgi:hypothetical protein